MKFLSQLARSIENDKLTTFEATSRRQWIKSVGLVSVSGAVLAACGTDDSDKKKSKSAGLSTDMTADAGKSDLVTDGGYLNAALSLEHEAIALYTAAAGLDFMKVAAVAPILAIAGTFLSHHTAHRDALIAAIESMRKTDAGVASPVASKSVDDYVAPVGAKLTDVKNVLRLASLKEMQAAQAYLGLISSFSDPELAKTSGMLGGDEASHYGALRAALFAVIQDADISADKVVPSALPTGFIQTF